MPLHPDAINGRPRAQSSSTPRGAFLRNGAAATTDLLQIDPCSQVGRQRACTAPSPRVDALGTSAESFQAPHNPKDWEKKYKFFSAQHMKASYDVFDRSRRDPYNKLSAREPREVDSR